MANTSFIFRFSTVAIAIGIALSLLITQPAVTKLPETKLAASTSPSYWITNDRGEVFKFGAAAHFGDMRGARLNLPVIGMNPTNNNSGYWLFASDGGIFSFGNAPFFGSTGSIRLNKPIVGMEQTKSGNGYWMVASDGGIFAYGDAPFFGSTGSIRLNKPIVGMAKTPTGNGYWLIASDGGIFAFGDARFYGSTGSMRLNKPIIGMAPTPDGNGYWMVASDGGIFAFGDARFYGSGASLGEQSFTKIIAAPDGNGYWLVRNGGDSLSFGSVATSASVNGTNTSSVNRPTVGLFYKINGPGDIAVLWAMSQSGKPYIWGGIGPDGYDCSGLTQQAWLRASKNITRLGTSQFSQGGQQLPLSVAKPGDLVFWAENPNDPSTIYHVAIYLSSTTVIMAPKTGDVVRTANIWTDGLVQTVVRPAA